MVVKFNDLEKEAKKREAKEKQEMLNQLENDIDQELINKAYEIEYEIEQGGFYFDKLPRDLSEKDLQPLIKKYNAVGWKVEYVIGEYNMSGADKPMLEFKI